jgi:hypothetical protein
VVILWQAVVWVIWRSRNNAIFSLKARYVCEAVDKIKHIT